MERLLVLKAGVLAILAGMLAAASILGIYLVQFTNRGRVADMVQHMWMRTAPRYAKQGRILARDEKTIIADSSKVARLVLQRDMLQDEEETFEKLSQFLKLSPQGIMEKVNAVPSIVSVELAQNLPSEIAEEIDTMRLPGVFIRYYYQRFYPFADTFAPHIVGYANSYNGLAIGLESSFRKFLAGKDGYVLYAKDGEGGIIPYTTKLQPPIDGTDITTTLDSEIQIAAEKIVRELRDKTKARWALIAVMNSFTGELLASAVSPAFDPNSYARGPSKGNEANPLIHFVYEPGSALKPIIAAVALDRGLISENEKFYCTPTLKIGKYTIHEAEHDRNPAGFGNIPIENIIVHSSNVGMARVGLKLGQKNLDEIFKTMALYEKTGIELPAERAGIKPKGYGTAKDGYIWPKITVANCAFGQGIAVTPLQLLRAYAAIANGGFLVKPTVVLSVGKKRQNENKLEEDIPLLPGERIVLAKGSSQPPTHSEGLVRVFSAETSQKVRRIMEKVVLEGTGKRAALPGYTVAGKTGTGEIAQAKGYVKGKYTSTFVGFFPKRNPTYLILVVVREPVGDYYGGLVCAPAFSELAQKIAIMKKIPPETLNEAK